MQEDSGLAMQHWRGQRTVSNRYEPWGGESEHTQVVISGINLDFYSHFITR